MWGVGGGSQGCQEMAWGTSSPTAQSQTSSWKPGGAWTSHDFKGCPTEHGLIIIERKDNVAGEPADTASIKPSVFMSPETVQVRFYTPRQDTRGAQPHPLLSLPTQDLITRNREADPAEGILQSSPSAHSVEGPGARTG